MRLFVAMDIPEDVRSAIGALTAKLRPACRNARWVRIEGLHVTLKFIGETPAEKVDAIEAALASIPSRAPIPINFRGLGFFPNERRPRVLWAGIEASAELAVLAAAVETAVDPLGIPYDERAYSPHLTLARFDTPRVLDAMQEAVQKAGRLEFGSANVKEFHLYQSVLKPGGAEYTSAGNFFVRREKTRVNLEMAAGAPSLWGLVVLGYLLGSIPFGYLLVRATGGGDIRFIGSGNIGATNVARTSGWSVGVATLALDVAKGFLAVWLAEHFSGGNIRFMMYAGLAAILGHIFPIWLRFVGGKGVATALGVFLAICWSAIAAAVLLFLLVALFWRYISLASISAAAALPLLAYLLYAPGHAPPAVVSASTLLAAIVVIVKHRDNIERLLAGTEPRFEMSRKKS